MDRDQRNDFGQPIGFSVPQWKGVAVPSRTPIDGRYVRIEPVDVGRHASGLFDAIAQDKSGSSWTYMGSGPFASLDELTAWMNVTCVGDDPLFHVVIDRSTDKPVGMAAYLRIEPRFGVIEVGHIHYSPALQRTRGATEAMYLLMCRVFDELGYRRYEWKCDALNAPSRRAAVRFGFTFEGIFRQAMIYKGRNRDTAWYAMIDREWPRLKAAYEAWLDPSNFDENGHQKKALGELTNEALR